MAKLSREKAPALLGDVISHWEQDLGDDFTVMGMTLVQLQAKLTALQTLLKAVEDLENELNVKAGELENALDEGYRDAANYRKAIEIAKGRDSREYADAPKLPTYRRKKAAEAPAQ